MLNLLQHETQLLNKLMQDSIADYFTVPTSTWYCGLMLYWLFVLLQVGEKTGYGRLHITGMEMLSCTILLSITEG